MAHRAVTEAARKTAQLPAELRVLPREAVTTDAADPDKIHRHDAPHIIKGLLRSVADRLAKGYKVHPAKVVKEAAQLRFIALCHDCNGKLPLTQRVIDIIRAKALADLSAKPSSNLDFSLRHVWFPDAAARGHVAGASKFELRMGVAPLDSTRPAPLRGLDLTLDITSWPPAVVDGLASISQPLAAHTAGLKAMWARKRIGLPLESNLVLS